jgi:hypothetical protein
VRGSGIRRGPQAAGHRGCRARQSPRRRACVRRTRRKLPPATTRLPWSSAVYGESSWPLFLRLLAPVLAVHGPGPPGWRAEGAPLKPVQNVVTSESEQSEQSEQRRTRANRASDSLTANRSTRSRPCPMQRNGPNLGAYRARRTLLLERHTSPLLSTGFRDISAAVRALP